MSGTTAILPASASWWSRSGARVVCQVFRFCSVGYGVTVLLVGGRAPEKDWDVLCRSTDGLVRCPLLGAACGGSRPRARGGPQSCGVGLPALARQAFDSGRRPGHASGGGFLVAVLVERVGQFEARPAQAQEQLVRGVRLVFGIEQDLHDLAYRRGVPEPGVDARPGGRPGQDGLEVFLLGAGGFRRVPVPRMAGQDPAHPGVPPLGRPFLHGPLGPLDQFSQ